MANEYQKVRFASDNDANEIYVMNRLNNEEASAYLAENGVTVEYWNSLYASYTFSINDFNKLFKVVCIDF